VGAKNRTKPLARAIIDTKAPSSRNREDSWRGRRAMAGCWCAAKAGEGRRSQAGVKSMTCHLPSSLADSSAQTLGIGSCGLPTNTTFSWRCALRATAHSVARHALACHLHQPRAVQQRAGRGDSTMASRALLPPRYLLPAFSSACRGGRARDSSQQSCRLACLSREESSSAAAST